MPEETPSTERRGSQILYFAAMQTTALISGMTCAHCVRAVFTSLAGVEGVHRADVSIGKAIIDHDRAVTNDAIRQAIEVAGYTVDDFRNDRRSLPIAP
jgi:copper chaperone